VNQPLHCAIEPSQYSRDMAGMLAFSYQTIVHLRTCDIRRSDKRYVFTLHRSYERVLRQTIAQKTKEAALQTNEVGDVRNTKCRRTCPDFRPTPRKQKVGRPTGHGAPVKAFTAGNIHAILICFFYLLKRPVRVRRLRKKGDDNTFDVCCQPSFLLADSDTP
jgi:hypothetical protein